MARKKKKRGRTRRRKRKPSTQGKHKPRVHPGVFTKVLFPNEAVLPGPIMDTEHTDAKAVWEKLRDQGQATEEPTDVGLIGFPTEKETIAELRYSFDNTEWAAVVTKDTEGTGVPCFRLWYQQGDRFQKSGRFPDGTKLAAYIRTQAAEKFKEFTPCIDTLDRLKGRTAASVVPDCFRSHARMAKCQTCPYVEECFEGIDRSKLKWIVAHEPGPDEQMEEPEEVFVKRLQGKVEDKWGPRVKGVKHDRVFTDEHLESAEALEAAKNRTCGSCRGTGQVPGIVVPGVGVDSPGGRGWIKCPMCNGRGTVEAANIRIISGEEK